MPVVILMPLQRPLLFETLVVGEEGKRRQESHVAEAGSIAFLHWTSAYRFCKPERCFGLNESHYYKGLRKDRVLVLHLSTAKGTVQPRSSQDQFAIVKDP